jgi:isopropylmalate/homocitrate/citramalate synthase
VSETEVRIVEVGPRDGLQNEKALVPTATKIALIDRLIASGLSIVEAGSFVSPKWVPQMADTMEVLAGIGPAPGVRLPVLVPNMKGLEAAVGSPRVDEIAVFAAASEAFSQRNLNCSIEESLERFRPVAESAISRGWRVRGYVSCVLGCPYQGETPVEDVVRVAVSLRAMGCYEISLGDTIGVGTPAKARNAVERVAKTVGMERVAVHFHDTYGQALANIYACLEAGVRVIDSSVAGLGGCPYAKGATGNVATEDVVYMLDGLGLKSGVDLRKLAEAGHWISAELGRKNQSRVACALFPDA